MPVVGGRARVLHLACVERVTIVAVEGTWVTVRNGAGTETRYGLHRLTGHFYRDGGPVTGPRLEIGERPPATG